MLCSPFRFPTTQAGQAVFAANSIGCPQVGATLPTVASNQQYQTHFFRVRTPLCALRNLKLHFANWTVDPGNVSTEIATGNTITVKAAVKLMRVAGESERQALFSGAASATIASGDTLASDALIAAPGFIPSGTELWCCVESFVATGGVRPGNIGGRTLGKFNETTSSNYVAAAFVDIPRSIVGDFTGQTATYSPIAMTAETVDGRTISIILHGDSISRGGDDGGDGFGNSGSYQRGLYLLGYPYGIMGVAGSNPQQAVGDANYSRRAAFCTYATTHLSQHGHNSAYGSYVNWGSLSGVLPAWWNYLKTKKNMAIVQTTLGPRAANGSADNYASLAGQSDGSGGLPSPSDGSSPQSQAAAGVRWLMNDQIRTKSPPVTGVIDIGPVWSDPTQIWKFKVAPTQDVANWYTTDGSHCSTRAAEAGVPVILAGAKLFA